MYSQAQIQVILDDVRKGASILKVAATHNVSFPTIRKLCRRYKVEITPAKPGPKGPTGPKGVVFLADIVRLKKTGKTVPQIAETLGCSVDTVKARLVRGDPKPRVAPWIADVDWRMFDIQIACNVGRSRERIRQVRKALGLPPSQGRNKRFAPKKS